MGTYYPACRATLGVIFHGPASGDSAPFIVDTQPTQATIHRNAYHQADSWSATFDARDLPLLPPGIRTGQIELYLYQTAALGGGGVAGPDGAISAASPTIVGLFDEVDSEYSEDGSTVTIQGQDLTALFIAKQWDVRNRLSPGRRLSDHLSDLIREVDPPRAARPAGTIHLDWRGDLDPIVGAATDPPTVRRRGLRFPTAKSFWDVIRQTAQRYGYIAFVEGFRVVVTRARRRLDDQDPRLRKVVWGRNLSTLRLTRRMGKEKTPQIRVQSWDSARQRLIEVRYPERSQEASVGVGTAFDEFQVFTVDGVNDREALRRAAENLYNLKAMGEQDVVVTTDELADFDARDLLDLRAGDPLLVAFDPYNSEELRVLNVAQRQRFLVDRGLRPRVAAALAANVDQILACRKPYRVRSASYDWSMDSGIDIEAELQEFVGVEA